jgi:putative ABC transport system substrate-binding protein
VRRREFITLLGAAAAWPLAARAQQPAMPVIGFLSSASPGGYQNLLIAFRRGLAELGFSEGRNIIVEYRWAEGRFDRLPALAADLVQRDAAVIVTTGIGAAAWPLAAGAQQPAMPVVGFLGSATAKQWAPLMGAFLEGLSEAEIVVGRNVTIEYRWAEGQYDRLPSLAASLVQRQVSVIAALTTPSAVAAKAATGTIPIVFSTIGDPVQIGLVASLRRPGGNITGATYLNVEVGPKLLELLHEVVPTATTVAALVNPTNPNAEILTNSLQVAAGTLGLELHVLKASTERDINTAFETLIQQRVGGLVVPSDVFLITHEEQLAALALRHRVPAISQTRAFAAAGGLMSYAGSALGAYRQAGAYTGRVLKGEKPADLPVQQTTKVELIVNLKTAKALGLGVPLPLIGRTDEVIE